MSFLRFITNTISDFVRFGTEGYREQKKLRGEIERLERIVKAQSTLLATNKR